MNAFISHFPQLDNSEVFKSSWRPFLDEIRSFEIRFKADWLKRRNSVQVSLQENILLLAEA